MAVPEQSLQEIWQQTPLINILNGPVQLFQV